MQCRSQGYGSLSIWVKSIQNGLEWQSKFASAVKSCSSDYTGPAVKINGGYLWADVYKFAGQHGHHVVGGADRVCIPISTRSHPWIFLLETNSLIDSWFPRRIPPRRRPRPPKPLLRSRNRPSPRMGSRPRIRQNSHRQRLPEHRPLRCPPRRRRRYIRRRHFRNYQGFPR